MSDLHAFRDLHIFAADLWFAAEGYSDKKAFWTASGVVLPILRQAADANGVVLVNPCPSSLSERT